MEYTNTGVRIPSKGQVDYATVAGSLGIASFLGLGANGGGGGSCCGNNGGGGLFAGLFGGNRNNCGSECFESKEAALLREQVSTLRAENFSRAASTQAFTDAVTFASNQNDKQGANLKDLFDVVIQQGLAIQKVDGQVNCQLALMQKDMEMLRKDIKIEADKRCCGDNSIVTYSNATFYPKQVANITTATTNVPQPLYNPLPNCGCCCD